MATILNMNKDKDNTIDLRMEVVQDFKCVDNCWNEPKRVDLVKGDVVIYNGGNSRSGNVSFKQASTGRGLFISHNNIAVKSLNPYCSGLIDTDYLEPIDWPEELLKTVTVQEEVIDNKSDESSQTPAQPINKEPNNNTVEPTQFTDKETATILAALRHWQDMPASYFAMQGFKEDGHFHDHDPLTTEEIDELCERVNKR